MSASPLLATLLALSAFSLPAATFYVSPTGSDTGSGTQSAPWRTIQRGVQGLVAGDQLIVASGEYGEYVQVNSAGAPGQEVTIRGEGEAVTKAFRLMGPYVKIDGFTLTGSQNLWAAHVRIESEASFSEIHNCSFGPGVYVLSDDFTWSASNNSLHSPSVNFTEAGFEPGAHCFFGASGLDGLWYDNHDTRHQIASVAPNRLTFSTPLLPETKNPAWAPVFAGMNRNGIDGIKFMLKGGIAASHCRITGCRFEDLFGMSIGLLGDGHEVDNNVFTKTNSYYGLRINGSDHDIHHNLFLNCSNFLFYTLEEGSSIPHPPGSEWYDYQVGFIHSPSSGSNVRFHHNWLENIDYQLGQVSEGPGVAGFHIENNVFVGVAKPLNGGRDQLIFRNNTFYRVGFDYPSSAALASGGNSTTTPQDGLVISRNVFVDCGSHWKSSEGSYTVTHHVTNAEIGPNFVAQFETGGYSPQPDLFESNSLNGGDPMFQDQENPRGPDGIPFTDDDGLRPLPNSPFAQLGWGALEPVQVVVGQPIAHFRVVDLSGGLGWKDPTRLDYDPDWAEALPYDRGAPIRPYGTPEALGIPGVRATFSAAGSIGGLTAESLDPTGIVTYDWDFGDGASVRVTEPLVVHTYQRRGSYSVRLTVTNSMGGMHSVAKTYRVLVDDGAVKPAAPAGLRTLAP